MTKNKKTTISNKATSPDNTPPLSPPIISTRNEDLNTESEFDQNRLSYSGSEI